MIEEEFTAMHDINLIYSQYMVDRVMEERREQARAWRRQEETRSRVPFISRVMALLRWQRVHADTVKATIHAAPTAEGARS